MMTLDSHADVLVIGAGVSGLIAARTLQTTGARVLLLDKGRGVGGRMATRRTDSGVFDHGAQFFTARDPQFRSRLAVLAQLAGVSLIPEPGGLRFGGEPISWMADNQRKGVSGGQGAAITIHAGPQFSQAHWATPEAEVTAALLGVAAPWLGSVPVQTQLHRWRYSLPLRVHPERCLVLREPAPLVFAGDAFGGPRVEGAALPGLAAGAALAELLSGTLPS